METAIITIGLGVVLFFIAFMGFKQGMRLGINTAKGEMPPTLVEEVKETVNKVREIKIEHEQVKVNKKFEEDMTKFMSYTGDVEEE